MIIKGTLKDVTDQLIKSKVGAGKYGEVNTEGLKLARGIPTTTPVAPATPAINPQVISGGRIPMGMAQPGTTGGAGPGAARAAKSIAAVAPEVLGAIALPTLAAGTAAAAGVGAAGYQAYRALSGQKPIGEDFITNNILGPTVDTSKLDPVPDLNVMGANAPGSPPKINTGGAQAPPANIKTGAQANVQTPEYKPGEKVAAIDALNKPMAPIDNNTPIDQSQFSGGGKGINYSLDAAGNVVAEAPTAKENPYDKDFRDTLDKIDLLNSSMVPSKSGYISDTIAENFDLITRIKGLKEKAAALQPMTTEGQGIPRALIDASKGKNLHPAEIAEKEAMTKVYNAKLEDANKSELKDQAEASKVYENQKKMEQSLIEGGSSVEEARQKSQATWSMREKSRRNVVAKNGVDAIEITLIDGQTYLINPKTGKTFLENVGGVPQSPQKKK